MARPCPRFLVAFIFAVSIYCEWNAFTLIEKLYVTWHWLGLVSETDLILPTHMNSVTCTSIRRTEPWTCINTWLSSTLLLPLHSLLPFRIQEIRGGSGSWVRLGGICHAISGTKMVWAGPSFPSCRQPWDAERWALDCTGECYKWLVTGK